MASIFTWEPDTPRVASPWLQSVEGGPPRDGSSDTVGLPPLSDTARHLRDNPQSGGKVTRLRAEPQDGPVEYKLHLLLRPRRKFRSTSTGSHVSGSRHARYGPAPSKHKLAAEAALDSEPGSGSSTPSQASTQQTRQHRLEQLTTQLLWRLQQSSPHHTSSATNTILPSLPEALRELQAPQQPAKLLHGLEESQGALYEIGVSDDGTLVGLAEDEMLESLNNLRAMAACLGCSVEVLREETVGECEWLDDTMVAGQEPKVWRSGKLVVAEALVKPSLQPASPSISGQDSTRSASNLTALPSPAEVGPPATTEQLRVTLTGPTMSGKSSLLGTLTTSTLDNGRGKSRLSMLRHRHEIDSGVTSSVTQELLGYQDNATGELEVVNYAAENVASWIDIHVASAGSRLVFISDSAGHPRYRRTTLRSLVGWAPHWTLLCIPADDTEDSSGSTGTSPASHQPPVPSEMDLSGAQLDLCLRLGLPLVVVITKLDLASRTGLRQSLTKVLDALKAAGRKPAIMSNTGGVDLQLVSSDCIEAAYTAVVPLLNDPRETVPIVLTSAVDGTNIGNLHALLHELPIPDPSHPGSRMIFDVEDVYSKPAEAAGVIVSGRVRDGHVVVGDHVVIGPFSGHDHYEDSEDSDERPFRKSSSNFPTSRSFPGALRTSHFAPPLLQSPNQEWRRVTVTSIRNLRLPVHSLQTDQVGTIAISLADATVAPSLLSRVRKGMVLAAMQPLATRTFTATFPRHDLDHLAVGSHVVVYMSSVRASAKIVSTRAPDSPDHHHHHPSSHHDPFTFDDDDLGHDPPAVDPPPPPRLMVTLSFVASKEFVMVGDRVLVTPSGGPPFYGGHDRGEKGLAGLGGFVGDVAEVRGSRVDDDGGMMGG